MPTLTLLVQRDGQPSPTVEVIIAPRSLSKLIREDREIHSLHSDADGRLAVDLPSGEYNLTVNGQDTPPYHHPFTLLQDPLTINLDCPPGRTFQGNVIDQDGVSLPGIEIMYSRLGGGGNFARTATDQQGHYVLHDVMEGPLSVSAKTSDGSVMAWKHHLLTDQEDSWRCDFAFPSRDVRYAGRVIERLSQEPIQGALVTLSVHGLVVFARTNDKGTFEVCMPAAERTNIHVMAMRYLRRNFFNVSPGEVERIGLDRGQSLEVRLRFRDAVPSCEVQLHGPGMTEEVALLDKDFNQPVEFVGLAPASYMLIVFVPGRLAFKGQVEVTPGLPHKTVEIDCG